MYYAQERRTEMTRNKIVYAGEVKCETGIAAQQAKQYYEYTCEKSEYVVINVPSGHLAAHAREKANGRKITV